MADPSFEPVDFNTAIQSPPMPLMLNLLAHGFGRGFVPEKRIRIVGTPLRNKADDQQFQVSLQTESSAASIPFHLNPRFNEKQNKYPWLQWLPFGRRSLVVRNNCVDGVWQREEGIGGFPFKVGAPFVLDLVARAGNKIEVFVDEKFYCDFCRVDLADISWMAVDGDLELRSVSLHNPNGFVVQNQKCPLDVHFSDIGLATGFVEPMCVRVTAADEQASPLEAAAANEFELAMLRRDGTSPFQVAINFGAGTVALRFQRLQPQLNDQGDSEVATTAPTEWLYQSSHFERGASPFTLELVAGPGHTVRTQLDGISIFADAPVQNLDAICRLRCTGPVQLGSLQIK